MAVNWAEPSLLAKQVRLVCDVLTVSSAVAGWVSVNDESTVQPFRSVTVTEYSTAADRFTAESLAETFGFHVNQ